MRAEILATGNEILGGALTDTNSAYIAGKLAEVGAEVVRHTCVGDELVELETALREIAGRAEIALVTGGLGPTIDDLTAEAAARAAGVTMHLDPEALRSVEAYFRILQRPVSASNRKQARLPQTAVCLPNPVGTAPGFAMRCGRCWFFFMPGVPHEMRRMLEDQVLPRIAAMQGDRQESYRSKTLTTFGLPESQVDDQLRGFAAEFPGVRLGLRAKFPEIQIKLYARGSQGPELETMLTAAVAWIRIRLGDKIISSQGASMEAVVAGLLMERQATIALAESCTGGLIAHRLTNIAGSSAYFLHAAIVYSNEAKQRILGVTPETLTRCGAVHEDTAKEMAAGARRLAGADYGLSTSGIAGPSGGTDAKPVGTVCIGVAGPDGVSARRYQFPFRERGMNKSLFAAAALNLLRRQLLSAPGLEGAKEPPIHREKLS
jgi:nicotinamide-nucleotide amidase